MMLEGGACDYFQFRKVQFRVKEPAPYANLTTFFQFRKVQFRELLFI